MCYSSSALVLVDEAAQDVVSDDLGAGGRGHWAGEWLSELEAPVGPGFVVMAEVLGKDGFEMLS